MFHARVARVVWLKVYYNTTCSCINGEKLFGSYIKQMNIFLIIVIQKKLL